MAMTLNERRERKAEREASAARMAAQRQVVHTALSSNTCPDCGGPRALVVYYHTETYGPRKSIVLCQTHRDRFYMAHPDACGAGEWKPANECEMCRKIAACLE